MAVICTKCGAELIGSVNRCWSCGQEFESRPDPGAKPPIRRSPVLGPLDAEPGADGAMNSGQAMSSAAQAIQVVEENPAANNIAPNNIAPNETESANKNVSDAPGSGKPKSKTASQPGNIRVGSPFASPSGASGPISSLAPPKPAVAPHIAPAVITRYPKNMAASSGALICLILGVFSIICSFYTVFAIVTALLGIGMGIWGLSCRQRKFAMVGILLCCIAMAFAGFNGVVDLYTNIHGVSPWEANLPIEDDDLPQPIKQFSN